MSSAIRRPHDAQASRQALLDAAAGLFQERGYDGATIREIGERAGVDPALIARYFDGKEGLYLAALADERHTPAHAIGDGDMVQVTRTLFDHWDDRGPSPALRAMVSPVTTPEVAEQVRAIFGRSLVGPLAQRLAERGLSQPRRRAALLIAAMAGVQMARQNGVLPEISDATTDELLDLLEPMAASLQGD
jgi:AcrR family transcriptional regulator